MSNVPQVTKVRLTSIKQANEATNRTLSSKRSEDISKGKIETNEIAMIMIELN